MILILEQNQKSLIDMRVKMSYAYTGRAEVAVGNVLAVMKAARYYLMSKADWERVIVSLSVFLSSVF